ncbi:hypothetical protein QRX50_44830 [Amycolatopsis carbonis]|uniref:Uncharacterized protein n=1 Tax=Amycolatopsis carbonis TaxID=715471 RepID=A0A9Y2IFX4_9PSEU|nr:hypothetical protein [Amycolatopsis sp. 2-15]WIX78405.1 hypothetical protein QRX50_44830 [Amycolatopsis sp. 2-15]
MTARLRVAGEDPQDDPGAAAPASPAGDTSTPVATSGGGRATASRGTREPRPSAPGLTTGERRLLEELLDSADSVTYGLSIRLAGVVFRIRENQPPSRLELELLRKRANRLKDNLDACTAFVAERLGERG